MVAGKSLPSGDEGTERLVAARGLTPKDLKAIADLEREVVASDGGRLKLEWSSLRSRKGDRVSDLLLWRGEELLGFLGIYSFGGGSSIELAGMVAPDARRQRIGSALLNTAQCVLRGQDADKALLVVPRNQAGGQALAQARNMRLSHSEHAMELTDAVRVGAADPNVTLRAATAQDTAAISELMLEAFGYAPTQEEIAQQSPRSGQLVVELSGRIIGSVRVRSTLKGSDIYGFAIAADLRGRGVGRDVLRRICVDLQSRGAARIGLEVETDNDRALGLYQSVGFAPVVTEDYYELTV